MMQNHLEISSKYHFWTRNVRNWSKCLTESLRKVYGIFQDLSRRTHKGPYGLIYGPIRAHMAPYGPQPGPTDAMQIKVSSRNKWTWHSGNGTSKAKLERMTRAHIQMFSKCGRIAQSLRRRWCMLSQLAIGTSSVSKLIRPACRRWDSSVGCCQMVG